MELLKSRKVLTSIVLTFILTLSVAMVSFAGVDAGANGEYCTLITVSGNGEAWTSTVDDPIYGTRSETDGMLVTIEYSAGCEGYRFACFEVDAQGNDIGSLDLSPWEFMSPSSSKGTALAWLPSSWFEEGKLYKVFSLGIFEGSTSASSWAYVHMMN